MTTQLKSNLVLLSEQVVDYSCMLCPVGQSIHDSDELNQPLGIRAL